MAYAKLVPKSGFTLSNENLTLVRTASGWETIESDYHVTSGKVYYEILIINGNNEGGACVGLQEEGISAVPPGYAANNCAYYNNGYAFYNSTYKGYGSAYTSGDIIGVAYNADNGTIAFAVNGSWKGTAYTGLIAGLVGSFSAAFNGGSMTLHSDPANMTYDAPEGFTAGLGEADIVVSFEPALVPEDNKRTITPNSSAITEDQIDFPLTLQITDEEIFTELGENSKKFSIEQDNVQLPVEIEDWKGPSPAPTLTYGEPVSYGGLANAIVRVFIPINENIEKFRLNLPAITTDYSIVEIWVGRPISTGSVTFDGNQVQVTFDGSADAFVSTEDVVSDLVELAYASGSQMLVSFKCGSESAFPKINSVTNGGAYWSLAGAAGSDVFTANSGGMDRYLLLVNALVGEGEAGKATIHTKIPTYSSSADGELTFSFDNSQPDNVDYVGEIGSAVGQSVFNPNFALLSHQAQDPGGTAPQILDSTSNANNGTTNGAMTSTDLIDGVTGKMIEYDGINDRHYHPATIAINDLGETTVDILFGAGIVAGAEGGHVINKGVWFIAFDTPNSRWIIGQNFSTSLGRWAFAEPDCTKPFILSVSHDRNDPNASPVVYIDGASVPVTQYNPSTGTQTSDSSNSLWVADNGGASRFIGGAIGEIRISNTICSADWIKLTALSLKNQLVTWSAFGETPVEQYPVRSMTVLPFDYSTSLRQKLTMYYGERIAAMLVMHFGDLPVLRAMTKLPIEYNPILRAMTKLPIDYAGHIRKITKLEWSSYKQLRSIFLQKYSISEAQMRVMVLEQYNLLEADPVRALVKQIYSAASGESVVQRWDVAIYAINNGVSKLITSCIYVMDEGDQGLYHMAGELKLVLQSEFLDFIHLETIVKIIINDKITHFLPEYPRKSRAVDRNVYIVPLVSKTVLLDHADSPYSICDLDEISGMVSKIITDLASPVASVDFRAIDTYIKPGRFRGDGKTNMALIKEVAASRGLVVQTSSEGTLIVRQETPKPLAKLHTMEPDENLCDQNDFYSLDQSVSPGEGYNKFYISDEEVSEDGERLKNEQISSSEYTEKVFMVPWSDSAQVLLHHSGGDHVVVLYNGMFEQTIYLEEVEFKNGECSVSKPVYGIDAVEWDERDLGEVTFFEEGNLEADVPDHSLAEVTYKTKYHSFTVINQKGGRVQVYPEVI